MSAGIGHNSGRVDEAGHGWRRHAWTRARAELLPRLPVEVVRIRVKRAQDLGLPYRSYAGFRAATGHDLVGFLFSSNALGVLRRDAPMPPAVVARLAALVRTDRVALVHPPLDPAGFDTPPLDAAARAPILAESWSATRARLRAVVRGRGHAADRYVVIGETALEREWCAAAGAAGFLTGAAYFGHG